MKLKALKAAFPHTIPVMTGYLFLGMAFGILLHSQGLADGWAVLMSVCVYAGSMQFAAIGLLTSAFSPVSAFLVTLMVNIRHLFYGLSMLEPFRDMGKFKPYLIFALSDETYSLECSAIVPEGVSRRYFFFFLSLLDQCYWIIGTLIGTLAGNILPFDAEGIDFAMTALFLVIFLEQWEKAPNHLPAMSALLITLLALVLTGSDSFLLFSMAGILLFLVLFRRQCSRTGRTA